MPDASDPRGRNDAYLRRTNLVLAFLAAIFLAMLVFGITSHDRAAQGNEVAADVKGSVQRVTLEDDEEHYPLQVDVRAGIPLEIVVPEQVADRLVLPELSITRSVTGGTVRLPSLDEGVYAFSCPGGYARGTIVAR